MRRPEEPAQVVRAVAGVVGLALAACVLGGALLLALLAYFEW